MAPSANLLKTTQLVVEQIAFETKNQLQLAGKVYRKHQEHFNPGGGGPRINIGDTIEVKKQRRYLSSSDMNFVEQPIKDQTFKVKIDQHAQVGMAMDVLEETFTSDGKFTDMASRDIKSAANTIADAIDQSLYLRGSLDFFGCTGVPGTTPGSVSAVDSLQRIADIRSLQTQVGLSAKAERNAFLDPKAAGYVPSYLGGLFVRQAQEAVTDGRLGEMVGNLNFFESANVIRHVAGTAITGSGSIASGVSTTDFKVDGANQTGSSLLLKSGGGAAHANMTFKAGDKIYLDVYRVNVVNKAAFGDLQQFTVTQDALSDANGAVTLNISPAIITDGAYQTVSGSPADSAILYGYNSATHNLIIVPETLALVSIPFPELVGGVICKTATTDNISVTLTVFGNGMNMKQYARLDAIWGVASQYPETGQLWLGQ